MVSQSTSLERIDQITTALRNHFNSGATRPQEARRAALRALDSSLREHEEALIAALHADMRKPRFEAYMSDVGLVYAEIDHALRDLDEWMSVEHVSTPLSIQPATSAVHREPLGVVLIIAPWNYPALLLLSPLVGAIAAGNCAVVKPSEETPNTAVIIERIIAKAFSPRHVAVVRGPGSTMGPVLIERFRFDHIFFTGSPAVGRKIMAMAAPTLTPVTLELGGKSPAIVDQKVNVKQAAARIAWSKYFNAGQTCIATDHALVHQSLLEQFVDEMARAIRRFYGDDPKQSPHFARLVNDKRFDTVKGYLADGRVRVGGQSDAGERYIAPTVMTDVSVDSKSMRDEVFGPVLPVLGWTEREEVMDMIGRNPFPLAAYVYSSDSGAQDYFTTRIQAGGLCINHGMLQFGNSAMPFGGVGTSGMGRYHGRASFDLFSHHKSVVSAATFIDHGLQYPPYSTLKERVLRWMLA
jgi:aldehyde dehydrogenase (NAD+)